MNDLLTKLGYAPGSDAVVIGRPGGLDELLPLPTIELSTRGHDWVLLFVSLKADVSRALAAAAHYRPGEKLWFAYPKKSGRLASDISRDEGWEPLIEVGFLGVTQVSIDDDWSAIRFRRREEIKAITRTDPRIGG
jgi:hypothetical protein